MKKTSKKKRKNYRLRRSVRRTLGALFMISAIIVAAIPFPDAAAVDDVNGLTNDSSFYSTGDRTPYVYSEGDVGNETLFTGRVSLKQGPNDDVLQALIIRSRSTNSEAYMLYDQFDYVERNFQNASGVNQGTYGVITKYNDLYATETIELTDRINKEYYTVTVEQYEDFYSNSAKAGTQEYTLERDNQESVAFFQEYFPGYYNTYLSNYTTYERELSAWQSRKERYDNGDVSVVVGTKPIAPELKLIPSVHMTDDMKLKFYCYSDNSLKGRNYKLTYVADRRSDSNNNTSEDKYIYVAQGGTPPNNMINDSNGFLVKSTSSIIAIGDNAFNTVTNVRYMTLPDEIKFVGDEAFKGSFLIDVNLAGVQSVGNRAFSGCTQLQNVNLGTTTQIGTEAFYGCTSLETIVFPYAVGRIGAGSFAACTRLSNVDLSNIRTSGGGSIGEGAFYNCSLGNLVIGGTSITNIEEGAFATSIPGSDRIQNVDFSESGVLELGEKLFSGRQSLLKVTMPAQFGDTESATLPSSIFIGCTGLGRVVFPSQCGLVRYEDENIFKDVVNDQFVVEGPAENSLHQKAYEREDTWNCRNYNGNTIPYLYSIGGEPFYEVKSNDYLLTLQIDPSNNTAILKTCDFAPGVTGGNGKLQVPDMVGPYKVVRLGDDCFSPAVKDDLRELEIKDNSIEEIGDGVFEDCTNLETVILGDSVTTIGNSAFKGCTDLKQLFIGSGVTKIGNSAFENCRKLDEVTFREPVGGAASFPIENLGSNAFSTKGNRLTFKGIVDPVYGPFAWAMEDMNYVDSSMGIRVCYKTPASTALNGILNPAAYTQAYGDSSETILLKDYLKNTPYLTVIQDNQNNYPTMVDYSHYEDLPEYLQQKYETNQELTPMEEAAVKATMNISIPAGIESIDVQGYMNDSSRQEPGVEPKTNGYNISTYFSENNLDSDRKDDYKYYGLFNGNNIEYPLGESGDPNKINPNETNPKGNDRIRSVAMRTVKYLPNYSQDPTKGSGAFYSCENLETVDLGSEMEDVGKLPFLGCYNLASIGSSSPDFVCNNKILYRNNPDGTKTVVECLGARGNAGDVSVNTENDPDLANVSEVEKGAFSDIPNLKRIDFTDNTILTDIPDQCFEKDPRLSQVILPPTVRTIGEKAFSGDQDGMSVTIYGREVSMASNAFDDTVDPTVVSYKDSAVYNQAKRYGVEVVALDETFKVQFFDFDGVTPLTDVQYIEQGKNAEPPEEEPTRDHYKFTGWNKSYKNITQNLDIIAMYEYDQNAGSDDPNDPNNPNNPNGNGGNGNGGEGGLYTLTVSGGSGGGQYAAGTSITILANAPASGSMFANWSSDDGIIFDNSTAMSTTIVMPAKDATVVANYTGQYLLKVNFGSGTGSYASGTQVTISAIDPPAGKVFDKWTTTTSGLTIAEPTKSTTTITMPGSNAEITATYKNGSSASGNSTSTKPKSKNGTTVNITKPGISNTGTASAYVNGSSDNFIVKISESQLAADEVQKALNKEYPDMSRIKYFAMDISLYDATGNTKITNFEGLSVNITMPIPDALKEYAGNNRIAGVVDGTLDKLNPKFTTIEGVPSISFTATHFSPYTIYVDTANLTEATGLDATPKTGDGIHPKWFLSIGLFCISLILFLKKDKRTRAITV